MKAEERRREIARLLMEEEAPVTGGELSKKLGDSRQIIVRDVALLKGEGFEIEATHSGYLLQKHPYFERVFKVKHSSERTEKELSLIVGLGGTVVDVFVWHKVYGKISAKLHIATQEHVRMFLEGVRSGKSTELMHVTGGYHYHTVRAEKQEMLDQIARALQAEGYLAAGD